jgi:hypothetical protein
VADMVKNDVGKKTTFPTRCRHISDMSGMLFSEMSKKKGQKRQYINVCGRCVSINQGK